MDGVRLTETGNQWQSSKAKVGLTEILEKITYASRIFIYLVITQQTVQPLHPGSSRGGGGYRR